MCGYSKIFMRDINALFRTALLITGSSELAECALLESIGFLSESEPLGGILAPDVIALTVARTSVSVLRNRTPVSDSLAAGSLTLLHESLHPVMMLPADLRCCFVLRTLSGYTHERVALVMNITTEDARRLMRAALLHFANLVRRRNKASLFAPAVGLRNGVNSSERAM